MCVCVWQGGGWGRETLEGPEPGFEMALPGSFKCHGVTALVTLTHLLLTGAVVVVIIFDQKWQETHESNRLSSEKHQALELESPFN